MSETEKSLIKVIWDDTSLYKEWHDKSEIIELLEENHYVESIGYKFLENDERIVLAGTVSYDGQACCSFSIIPKRCIVKTLILVVSE